MGAYHPMEGAIYDAWNAGYEAGLTQCEKEINYLKAQLLRANTNDGAYKAAYLAGQLSAKELIKAEKPTDGEAQNPASCINRSDITRARGEK
jgi:hypothetical protein